MDFIQKGDSRGQHIFINLTEREENHTIRVSQMYEFIVTNDMYCHTHLMCCNRHR